MSVAQPLREIEVPIRAEYVASVLPQLRTILDNNSSLVKRYGDLARHPKAAWIALAGGADLYMRESFARAAEARWPS